VDDSIPFSGSCLVRRRYYQSMRAACGESRTRRYVVEPPIHLPGRLDATAFDLVKLLNNDGVKIYATGHSLGGGLATLFAAHIKAHLGVLPAAVVSFGSPPVAGNGQFVSWFRKSILHSWRFVYGNEFAPMCPPLPFTSNVRLLHVDSLIDVQRLRRCQPSIQRTYEEYELCLDQLARSMNLSTLLYDHNPILIMRVLHLEMARAAHSVSSLSLED
jgi:pimeloyl-ACP methyl ester carboxylesterase